MVKPLDIVREMKTILSLEDRWTKNVEARNKNQRPTSLYSEDAYSFCLLGALNRAHSNMGIMNKSNESLSVRAEMKDEVSARGFMGISDFNDHADTTFDDITDFLDKLEKRVS